MAELLKESELSPGKSSDAGDQEFEPSADMLVHDYDDEQTLAEEEALAIAGGEDPQNELNSLQKESDMPLEELLALYGYGERGGGTGGGGEERIGRLEEDMEEDEEEDEEEEEEEEEEEDESVESTSSSSTALVPDTKGTKRPGSKSEASGDGPSSKTIKTENSIFSKNRSDLHLLYAQTTEEGSLVPEARLLRSAGAAGANAGDEEEEVDEEDDVDYAPGEDEWRKTIMIGSDYQAFVPSGLSPYENSQTLPYENDDKLLWTPSQVAGQLTEEYLQKCTQIQQQLMQSRIAAATASQPLQTLALLASLPLGAHTRDDEQALHLLLQCGYNVEEALRRRKMSTVTSCDTASLWSEEECRNFEAGLRIFGKDFHHIQQQKVRTRSVGELVQFYYLWKKTERHDVLANRARLEKKKYALHPGTTDYMDRFLDEQEQPANVAGGVGGVAGTGQGGRDRSHSRSSSPNVHSLIYGDPKRLRVVATPPAAVGEDGAVSGSNGVVHPASASVVDGMAVHSAEDSSAPVNSCEAESGNGQVLSAAAAAAAAAAAVLPPSSTSSANASSSSSSASSSASSPSSAAAAAAGGDSKTQRTEASS